MALSSITQHASETASGATISVPGTIQAGDLIVLLDVAYNTDFEAPASAVPTGFTIISNLNLLGNFSWLRMISSYKLADGSEAMLSGMSGELAAYKMLYVMRGNVPATQVNVASVNQQATSGNPSPQVVSASSGVAPLVVFGCYGSDGSPDPRTFTPAKDGEIASQFSEAFLAYKIYNSSPQNTTVDMDDEGSVNLLQSFYIEMASDAASGVPRQMMHYRRLRI